MQVKKFSAHLNEYSAIFKKLLADSIWRYKGKSVFILITGFLGITFQIQSIGIAFYYAKAIEKGRTFSYFGFEADARSLWLLCIFGIAVLISFLLSAWMIYLSRTGAIKMMREYEEFCAKRVFLLFGSSLEIGSPSHNFSNDSEMLMLLRTDSRYCGIALLVLLHTVIPFITTVAATGFLFYINITLTCGILVLAGISAIFQYKVSLAASKSSALQEKCSKGAFSEYKKIIQRQKYSASPISADSTWSEKLFNKGVVKQYLDAYEGRLKVIENSRLVGDILLAISMFAIMITLGVSIISKQYGWDKLIIYLVAMRYSLVNARATVVKLTSLNRYYPQIKRYLQFIGNAVIPPEDRGVMPEQYTIHAASNRINGSLAQWNIGKGGKIGLISPVAPDRYTTAYLAYIMFRHSAEHARKALSSMWFASAQFEGYHGTLMESLNIPSGGGLDELKKMMETAGLWDRVGNHLPDTLKKPVPLDKWKQIEPDIRFALAMISALNSGCQWLLIEEKGFNSLPAAAREFFSGMLSDRIAVFVFNDALTNIGMYKEDIIAVSDENGIIGLGSAEWAKQNELLIADVLHKDVEAQASRLQDRAGDDMQEDLDEM